MKVFGGRAGLQAGVRREKKRELQPPWRTTTGPKGLMYDPERGPEGPLFHGGANGAHETGERYNQ
jgi:hypothetical protein